MSAREKKCSKKEYVINTDDVCTRACMALTGFRTSSPAVELSNIFGAIGYTLLH